MKLMHFVVHFNDSMCYQRPNRFYTISTNPIVQVHKFPKQNVLFDLYSMMIRSSFRFWLNGYGFGFSFIVIIIPNTNSKYNVAPTLLCAFRFSFISIVVFCFRVIECHRKSKWFREFPFYNFEITIPEYVYY